MTSVTQYGPYLTQIKGVDLPCIWIPAEPIYQLGSDLVCVFLPTPIISPLAVMLEDGSQHQSLSTIFSASTSKELIVFLISTHDVASCRLHH